MLRSCSVMTQSVLSRGFQNKHLLRRCVKNINTGQVSRLMKRLGTHSLIMTWPCAFAMLSGTPFYLCSSIPSSARATAQAIRNFRPFAHGRSQDLRRYGFIMCRMPIPSASFGFCTASATLKASLKPSEEIDHGSQRLSFGTPDQTVVYSEIACQCVLSGRKGRKTVTRALSIRLSSGPMPSNFSYSPGYRSSVKNGSKCLNANSAVSG
jgi:hypothetical protein